MSPWPPSPEDRLDPDAEAVAEVCPYEADVLDADVWRALGFYPDPEPAPPF